MNRVGGWRSDRAALLFGLAVVSLVLGVTRGLPAWLGWSADARAAAVRERLELDRRRWQVDHVTMALDSAEQRVGRLRELGGSLLSGEGDPEIEAQLARIARRVALTSGMELHRLEAVVEPGPRSELRRARGSLRMTGGLRELTEFLVRLEGGPELLAVRHLTIRSRDLEAWGGQHPDLEVEVTVEGLGMSRVAAPEADR